MSIATLDDYIASTKQIITYSKTASRTTVANVWFTVHDQAGNPGGTSAMSAGNTANGVVPNDSTSGFPTVTFSSGLGYLADVDFGSTVACRLGLFDRVFAVGAFAYNNTGTNTLSSQPSFSGRMPGSSYAGTQIWLEVTTAFASGNNWKVEVTYTDQSGNAGHTTGQTAAIANASLTLGKMLQLPLAAGDSGVQKIETVIVTNGSTVMTAGNFNILVLRPLWTGRINVVNAGDCHGIDRTGMPQVFGDSALQLLVNADSSSSGLMDCAFCIASN
jgi:hypothetical protein